MAQVEVSKKIGTRVNNQLKEPTLYRVIYINDDQTSAEFVVGSLVEHFDYTPATAEMITNTIHETGAATVAVLPYEIAEQKGIEITVEARSNNFPLQIKLEPDEA